MRSDRYWKLVNITELCDCDDSDALIALKEISELAWQLLRSEEKDNESSPQHKNYKDDLDA